MTLLKITTRKVMRSEFDMAVRMVAKNDVDEEMETLISNESSFEGSLNAAIGEQGDFIVSIIPSLSVSGYGVTIEEAFESLGENLNTLFEDLFALSHHQRKIELLNLGWILDTSSNDKFSKVFIDEKGLLVNFDH